MTTQPAILQNWNATAIIFLSLSVIGLVGTLNFKVLSVVQMRNLLGDWFGSDPAVNSLGADSR